jgi:glycosyltransferase involved in cell wall biosynthesis
MGAEVFREKKMRKAGACDLRRSDKKGEEMKPPKISVALPIYNTDPRYLRECIESILAQTFKDFELLILNDSPDNAKLDEIVASYDDPRIIYSKNEKNMGIANSRNKLHEMARGEYIAVVDHDDISMPERFRLQAEFLDAHPEIGAVSSQYERIPQPEYFKPHPKFSRDIKLGFMTGCPFAHPACMLRKSVMDDNGIRYEQHFSPSEDYRLFCRLMDFTGFYNLDEVLLKYRWHETNTSITQKEKMEFAYNEVRIYLQNKYPALYIQAMAQRGRKAWLKLFGIIPFIKLKRCSALLFGFIPLFKWKLY